ncbi:hypothetical protein JNJ66_02725 [Candidatus Saccharibacteria bacterium]|nr:hypothetical protein [Candidatus Saccharibacteria bacterium]
MTAPNGTAMEPVTGSVLEQAAATARRAATATIIQLARIHRRNRRMELHWLLLRRLTATLQSAEDRQIQWVEMESGSVSRQLGELHELLAQAAEAGTDVTDLQQRLQEVVKLREDAPVIDLWSLARHGLIQALTRLQEHWHPRVSDGRSIAAILRHTCAELQAISQECRQRAVPAGSDAGTSAE